MSTPPLHQSHLTNAATKIDAQVKSRPKDPALWLPRQGSSIIRSWARALHGKTAPSGTSAGEMLTFEGLDLMARRAASLLMRHEVRPGDRILLAVELSYDLYAWVLAATRLGASVLLVEPWLRLADIEKILQSQNPRFFVAHTLGRLWGLRVPGVRRIPHKIDAQTLSHAPARDHETVAVAADDPCLIAFTSGTTGEPKGLVRSHGYLDAALTVLNKNLHFDTISGADLVIFANFTLANLANGRLSLIMPSRWSTEDIKAVDLLPTEFKPRSVTTGPAYMRALFENSSLSTLRHIHVGGALTSNAFFEQLFVRFPEATITHLYGSSEVEPVAAIDAREAVLKSRARGFFHTLCVGQKIPEVELKQVTPNSLWVSGPHVSPEYLGNSQANLNNKFRDSHGRLWHRMGDHVQACDIGLNGQRFSPTGDLYYMGRDHQPLNLVLDEQRLYHLLGHDHAFLEPDLPEDLRPSTAASKVSPPTSPTGQTSASYTLYLEPCAPGLQAPSLYPSREISSLVQRVRSTIPRIRSVFITRITRDKRHRARIDRVASKAKAKKYV